MDLKPEVLLSAFSALGGALIGGLAAVLSSWVIGHREERLTILRWRREDATRFHEPRRDLYARYVILANLAYKRVQQRGDLRRQEATSPGALESADKLTAEIAQIVLQVYELLAQIRLVGTGPLHNIAEQIAAAVQVWQIQGYGPPELDKSSVAATRYIETYRPQFYLAARAELGVPAGSFEQSLSVG